MLEYIWFDDKSPILNQLPKNFKSAAILLHPFIQMPLGWEKSKRKNEFEHIYPTDQEILQSGKPISWETMRKQSGLNNLEELAIALKSSIGALNENYLRKDLAKKLVACIKDDLYYPYEDFPSVFLITDLLNVLSSKGAKQLSYSDPLLDKSEIVDVNQLDPLKIFELALNELLITDENMDFAFMNVYDSFITIIMGKDDTLNDIVKTMSLEAIICDKNTYINWYSKAY